MRTLTTAAQNSANSPDGDGIVWLALLKIETTTETYHLVSNNEDITGASGQVYQRYEFELMLPDDTKDTAKTISLSISNIDNRLVMALRNQDEPPIIEMKVVVSPTFDDINPEIMVSDLVLRDVNWTAMKITGTLSVDSMLNQKFPSNAETYDPLQFGGLF